MPEDQLSFPLERQSGLYILCSATYFSGTVVVTKWAHTKWRAPAEKPSGNSDTNQCEFASVLMSKEDHDEESMNNWRQKIINAINRCIKKIMSRHKTKRGAIWLEKSERSGQNATLEVSFTWPSHTPHWVKRKLSVARDLAQWHKHLYGMCKVMSSMPSTQINQC